MPRAPRSRPSARASILCLALAVLLLGAGPGTASAARPPSYANPVIAGDHPDPTVLQVGRDYYASGTSSDWAPVFPIYHSRDLVNWAPIGRIFRQPPAWAEGLFWAPELTQVGGRYLAYYTARKRGLGHCIGVASASRAAGPYHDHGPKICQVAGSIDGFPVRDENGTLQLVWKEGPAEPGPIWAQALSGDGLEPVGERKEIFRAATPWEGALVEGPGIIRRGPYFYMFYSGPNCCGYSCAYSLGVARSPSLLGPWERHPRNPILRSNAVGKCPGHSAAVTGPRGGDFLLYAAYPLRASVPVGRHALLDEIRWAGGWPQVNNGTGPSRTRPAPSAPQRSGRDVYRDGFRAGLDFEWQWPQADPPPRAVIEPGGGGSLLLAPTAAPNGDPLGAVLTRRIATGDYRAEAIAQTPPPGTYTGLSAFGNRSAAVGLAVGAGQVIQWRRDGAGLRVTAAIRAPRARSVRLRLVASGGRNFRFQASGDGRRWHEVGGPASFPPWNEPIRIALTSGGRAGAASRFDSFRIEPPPRPRRPPPRLPGPASPRPAPPSLR